MSEKIGASKIAFFLLKKSVRIVCTPLVTSPATISVIRKPSEPFKNWGCFIIIKLISKISIYLFSNMNFYRSQVIELLT